ncbi:hypothetical protein [Lactiplantibacillus plantarum]|uniref:hypothetical protein n=1 Tax=Lactiplantibacillus plantarum TaxID=1590 RepID=UPI0020BDFB5B|nr:hypothetical protein [Lactiplantibacillus plantarum]
MNNIKEVVRRINLQLIGENDTNILTFVTINESISQPTIIANLAMMYARANEKVCILDMNFKDDGLEHTFRANSENGLFNYLEDNNVTVQQIITQTKQTNLSLVSSGSASLQDSKYAIGDPKFSNLLKILSDKYEKVLINVGPLSGKTDERIKFLTILSGIVLISDIGNSSKKGTVDIVKTLVRQKVKILGYISANV